MNWKSRGDRIERLQKKQQFDRFFMPLVYLVAAVGILFIAYQGIRKLEEGHYDRGLLVVGIFLLGMPLPLWIFRWMRGHYSPKLKD